MAVEPCLDAPCRSPVACSGFGYCRERNAGDKITTPEMIEARRRKVLRRRHATEEEVRMFDEALMAAVKIIDSGIRQDEE